MKLEDLNPEGINILLKGEPSGGKSIAAASFPNCYIFDFENRIRSVANYYLPRGKRDIDFDTYGRKDFEKFQSKVNSFMVHCPYDTIIFDTLTSLVDLLLYHAAEMRGTSKGSRIVAGLKMNTIEDYGAEDAMIRSLLAHLRDLKIKYKILIGHVIQREQKSLSGASVITRQLITAGKAAGAKVPAYFDEVYHLQQRPDMHMKPEFIALTANTGDDFARTTLDLPREINFTNQSLYELLKKELTKEYKYPTEPPNVQPAQEDNLNEEDNL